MDRSEDEEPKPPEAAVLSPNRREAARCEQVQHDYRKRAGNFLRKRMFGVCFRARRWAGGFLRIGVVCSLLGQNDNYAIFYPF